MGLGARNSSERLRTIWTPEMDRYFVDLLLEQVRQGTKFDDHLTSKRAWIHMSSLFNAKFNFHYEKDILKNRYKTLRNLYRVINNLLANPGFSWDQKRSMVTADNPAWDEYLKLNPAARSHRIKSIPYFKDLCIIYGNAVIEEKGDNAPGGSSYSGENETFIHLDKNIGEDVHEVLHDIMVDEDFGISTLETENDDSEQRVVNETATPFSTRTRTYWQPPMDRYFINQMLAHVYKGNRPDGVFSRQAWMEMILSFNEKFGFDYSLEHLKNRYKTLRRQYNLIKNLLDLDAFVWDESRQMVTADDSAWQDCIKHYMQIHPDARQFMTRPLPYYKDLCIICNPKFEEKKSTLLQDIEHQNIVDVKIDSDYASPAGHSSITSNPSEEQLGVVKEVAHSDQKQKRQLEKFSGAPISKHSRNEEHGMAVALREMATAVSSLSTEKNDENPVSIETVIHAVQALPDMDEDLVLDACDFLEDERKAKIFLALDIKLRKKWLIRKLRTQA
ncbi:L10-interacting MYB domain-containing protein isoform X1 [Arachis duranensis]|uniref:L10-interacting MYB domain-containing protein isoform X1 n=1 Tax=Arachis duranensis TaxID=130453 RepID=A0A6P5MGX2_ARADU|nr:L10-interacting MYB domain-containing protein isoform X1 [Arachis duranensis]